jgi:hypothetical protein
MIRRCGHGKVAIVPHLSLPDGIQATRKLLQCPRTRFHSRCDIKPLANDVRPFEAIHNYHYEWDEDAKVLAKKPLHDWSSHTCDALRMAGVVAQMTMQLDKKPELPEKPIIPTMDKSFHLEDLWEQRERTGGTRWHPTTHPTGWKQASPSSPGRTSKICPRAQKRWTTELDAAESDIKSSAPER